MKNVLTLGQMLSVHARLHPHRMAARDLERDMTFQEWNGRARRLANALLGLGLAKGDRVAILAYNAIEWVEIYGAAAKAGLVAVPLNFRLVCKEIRYIVDDSEAAALIVQDQLVGAIEEVGAELSVPASRRIWFGSGQCPRGYLSYEELIARARDSEPEVAIAPEDPWMLMYTSGATGNPKGAIRNHWGAAMLSLVTEIELGMSREDGALLVMPMCHANSLYFFGAFAYCGATTTVYSRKSFDPEHCARVLGDGVASFTSMVPTHYAMMLALPAAKRAALNFDRVAKLMISSAPARPDTKRAIMEMFPKAGLFELYGSTETGWTTMLHPHEQFDKLGSVGRECVGSAPIRMLDAGGKEVADGEVGELYANNPYLFDGYWKLPEKTREAFHGDYCTVGDMARRDEDGYIHLVDRKSNMIITGGENVYPSDVEAIISGHPSVHDVAVIGLPDDKWGERVHAVIVLKEGSAPDEASLHDWCKTHMAAYKRPRAYSFMRDKAKPDYIAIADGDDLLSFARVGLEARTYMDAGAFGCLGVGVPYAVAAALACPDRQVVCITGDGAFGLNAMEIDTAVRHRAKIVVIVSNNAAWNIERALANAPALVDVVTSQRVVSSDATKGLGFVPEFQALTAWDDFDRKRRGLA